MKKQLLLILFALLPMLAMADDSGSCGTNVTWTYTESTKTLTIQGNGAMNNYSYGYVSSILRTTAPWKSYVVEIKEVIIKDGVTGIGKCAFYGCSGLTSVTIGNSVTSIGWDAFYGCSSLTSVTIPNSVTTIGWDAFYQCTGLTSISVENGNEKYDSRNNCNAIIETASNTLIAGCKNTTIPNSVTSIGEYAFSYCSGLTSVTIPNSVTSIGQYAFSGCSGLTSVTIPNSVTCIGVGAFSDCTGLTSITIPNSVTSIGSSAFYGTAWYNNQPDGLVYAGKVAYKYKGTMPSNTSVSIKDGTLGIGDYAFFSCSGLTSVTIPNSVTIIGDCAFSYCSGLTSVTIPNSVTSIGNQAFDGVDFPTVVSLIENPFKITGKTLYNRVFTQNTFNNATLYVPKGTIDKYKATNGWKDFLFIEEGNGPGGGTTPTTQKCEKPTISYQNDKLTFSCATDGATCQYSITDTDIKAGSGNEVQLTATYNISVYATKLGYENSETATATLCWIDQQPKTEGITNGIANIPANAVLIQSEGGNIKVQGIDEGTQVNVYSVNGTQAGSAISQSGAATINTNLQLGSVAIVKIGQKSVKVVMK